MVIDSYIDRELQAGRLAGPFPAPSSPVNKISPIGLVPKSSSGAGSSSRYWAIAAVANARLEHVLLIVGGNDLAQPAYNSSQLLQALDELVLGMLTAGTGRITACPILPRTACRRGAAIAAPCQRLTNMLLRRRYAGAFQPAESFLERDGVHPSREDWREFSTWILQVADLQQ